MRDRAVGATIRLLVSTHTQSTGVAVAPSSAFVAADFRIYKDGSATQKTTTNGITVTSPFASLVGSHLVAIDTGNSTGDVGFWESGSAYRVVLVTAKTVDSKDPSNVCVGEFSLELQTADVRKFGGSNGTFAAGIPEAKVASIAADAIVTATFAAGTTIPRVTLADTTTTNTDMRGTNGANTVVPTNLTAVQVRAELATELGRIDALISSRSTFAGGAVASVTGAVGSVTAAITLPTIPTDWVTANGIAANAIGASELAADGVAEIQSGLATQASLDDVPTNAELSTALGTADDATLAAIAAEAIKTAAIKVVTDRINTGLVLDGAVWQFTVNMLELGPAGGGGGGGGDASQTTSDEILAAVTVGNARLVSIGQKTTLISAGRIRVLSRVSGNTITAKAGDDHLVACDNALSLEVDDDDSSLYALLTDAGNTAVEFGAGRENESDEITADIVRANITHEGTQTFIPIELAAAATAGKRLGDYEYDIQVTNSTGLKVTRLVGTLVLTADRKS